MSARTSLSRHTAFVPAPLPGTGPAPRGLFIGRWGAFMQRPARGQRLAFSPSLLAKGSIETVFRAAQAGWTIYLIGNEEAVAHGKVPDTVWERFAAEFAAYVQGQGIPVKRHYACVDHPHGKGPHRRDSVFLFPNTGALYHAAQEDGIELSASWVVANDVLELAAGWRAGCRMAGIDLRDPEGERDLHVEPTIQAPSLAQVLTELLSRERRLAH